jgi:hypothetical protein
MQSPHAGGDARAPRCRWFNHSAHRYIICHVADRIRKPSVKKMSEQYVQPSTLNLQRYNLQLSTFNLQLSTSLPPVFVTSDGASPSG